MKVIEVQLTIKCWTKHTPVPLPIGRGTSSNLKMKWIKSGTLTYTYININNFLKPTNNFKYTLWKLFITLQRTHQRLTPVGNQIFKIFIRVELKEIAPFVPFNWKTSIFINPNMETITYIKTYMCFKFCISWFWFPISIGFLYY